MKNSNKIFTVPNILTLLRLFLVPIFVVTFFYVNEMLALAIFVIAGLTDILDGYIARRFNSISNLGKVLDPLADKTLRLSTIAVFVVANILPLWVLIVMVSFDALLIITSAVLFKKNYVVSSNVFGKLAGFFNMFALTLCFFYSYIAPAHLIFIYISVVLVFISIITYALKVKKEY
ncbi:MAG: CDP-alcohol phosphatidyltransferase family protein [Clostridia bacterium]|nr:CDP-alcohol phosphatidyltransferase family protein [Clostridia bacterium]